MYRRMFRERRSPVAAQLAHTRATSQSPTDHALAETAGHLLCLPLRLTMLSIIEEGLFVDLASQARRDLATVELATATLMTIAFGLVIAVLYFVLIFAPLRAPWLVRLFRERRAWAWLPGFAVEVTLLVVVLLR